MTMKTAIEETRSLNRTLKIKKWELNHLSIKA